MFVTQGAGTGRPSTCSGRPWINNASGSVECGDQASGQRQAPGKRSSVKRMKFGLSEHARISFIVLETVDEHHPRGSRRGFELTIYQVSVRRKRTLEGHETGTAVPQRATELFISDERKPVENHTAKPYKKITVSRPARQSGVFYTRQASRFSHATRAVKQCRFSSVTCAICSSASRVKNPWCPVISTLEKVVRRRNTSSSM